MNNQKWRFARYGVFLLLIFLIAISSHPTIMEITHNKGIETGTVLSPYIILVFGALFLLVFDYFNIKSYFSCKTVVVSWIAVLFILLYGLMTLAIYRSNKMFGDVRAIIISIVAIMIGWSIDLDKKGLYWILLTFAGMVLYVGLMQVFVNIGGFEILDQYESDNKNSLGVMLAISGIIFLFLGLDWEEAGWVRIVFFLAAIGAVVVLLTIRARASTLGFGMVALFVLFERFKRNNFALFAIVGVFVVVILYLVLPQSVSDYVYESFFQNYENGGDVTTGRMDANIEGLNFVSQHIWVGNLNANHHMAWIHNYPLEKLYKYGFIFAFPMLALYLYLFVSVIVKAVKSDNHDIYNIGYYLLLVPFLVSMAEPTFPFGPGTAMIFSFVTFGISLRNAFDGNKDDFEEEIEEGL